MNIELKYIGKKEKKEDYISNNEVIFYMLVEEFMPSGFYTSEYREEISVWKSLLLKNERGYIVMPELGRFEVGDYISLRISKNVV